MSTEAALQARSESKCELCGATESLVVYAVPPNSDGTTDQCLLTCESCREQIEDQKIELN
ncbi:MAG: hypothetical protein GY696_31920 [Gammaproteobacteria bacterium]|nr:hypothetical protein [Gammaproteobacteria bacterium]